MSFQTLSLQMKTRLQEAQLECADPALHARQILEATLGIDSAELLRRWQDEPTAQEQAKIEAFLKRRLTGEPFQYIVGYEWFWKKKFEVGPGVLIPRPETELLVELALQNLPEDPLRIAELGAGSGNIGISLLGERPQWEWNAWEISDAARVYTEKNRVLLPRGAVYRLHAGDFFSQAPARAPFDALIANPPYVAGGEIATLSREVRHEPREALDGGESGLEVVEHLAASLTRLLVPDGWVFLEIGSDQGEAARRLLSAALGREALLAKDLSGRDRVVYGSRRASPFP